MTSCPDSELIEDLAFERLPSAAAASIRSHVSRCARCAEEHAAFASEHALFSARGEVFAPPARAVVSHAALAVERPVRRAAHVPWTHVLVAACAACALIVTKLPSRHLLEQAEGASVSVEPENAGPLASFTVASFVLDEPRACFGLESDVSMSEGNVSLRSAVCHDVVTSGARRP